MPGGVVDQQASPDRADIVDLVVADGKRRVVLRFNDAGVAPGQEALFFMRAGHWVRMPYSDIESVTISSHWIGRGGRVGQCAIAFRDGTRAIVMTVTPQGSPDAGRVPRYRSFLRIFHERLLASGVAGISFHSGLSENRMAGLNGALAAGFAMFVLLPLVLFLVTEEQRALWLMVGGVALLWPALRMREQNKSGSYDPADPPDLLR